MIKGISVVFATVLFAFASTIMSSASATPILKVENGQLIGALGVDVDGQLLDVSFIEGSCIASFTGCDDAEDFFFQDQQSATAASQALLDQVLIDNELGLFDSDPTLVNGCANSFACYPTTPFSPVSIYDSFMSGFAAYNSNNEEIDQLSLSYTRRDVDISILDFEVWADWQISRASVPEPNTLLLMLTGVMIILRSGVIECR